MLHMWVALRGPGQDPAGGGGAPNASVFDRVLLELWHSDRKQGALWTSPLRRRPSSPPAGHEAAAANRAANGTSHGAHRGDRGDSQERGWSIRSLGALDSDSAAAPPAGVECASPCAATAVYLPQLRRRKRPAQYDTEVIDVTKGFDHARFHFGKAKHRELMFVLQLGGVGVRSGGRGGLQLARCCGAGGEA